jgi:hypothetical protein
MGRIRGFEGKNCQKHIVQQFLAIFGHGRVAIKAHNYLEARV